jgi:hypothetical protein
MATTSSVQELQNSVLFKQFIGIIQTDISDFIEPLQDEYIIHAGHLLQQLFEKAGPEVFELFTATCVYRPKYNIEFEPNRTSFTDVGMGVVHLLAGDIHYAVLLATIIAKLYGIDPAFSTKVLEIENENGDSVIDLVNNKHIIETVFVDMNDLSTKILAMMLRAKTSEGYTPLHRISEIGNLMNLKTLFDELSVSELLNLFSVEYGQRSVLYMTCVHSHQGQFIQILKYLHMRCSEPETDEYMLRFQNLLIAQNYRGYTMLHLMVIFHSTLEIMKTLIAVSSYKGSLEITIKDKQGNTVLDMIKLRIVESSHDVDQLPMKLEQQKLLESIEPYLFTKSAAIN